MNSTTSELLKVITSKAANWLTPVIATAIAFAITKLATVAPWIDLTALDAAAIAGAIVAVIIGTVNAYTNKHLTQGTATVQALINKVVPGDRLDLDGIAGPNTVNKVAQVVSDLLKK
jgi:hypothetical protein